MAKGKLLGDLIKKRLLSLVTSLLFGASLTACIDLDLPDEVFYYDCPVMDPVRLKIGNTYFSYPAWYSLPVQYDYLTNPIKRRKYKRGEPYEGSSLGHINLLFSG